VILFQPVVQVPAGAVAHLLSGFIPSKCVALSLTFYTHYILTAMTEIQNLLSQLQDKGWSKAAITDAVKLNWYTIYRWCRGDDTEKSRGCPAAAPAEADTQEATIWTKTSTPDSVRGTSAPAVLCPHHFP
jgi:hypothetical protein